MHHRFQRKDHHHQPHLPHLLQGRLQRRTGRQHRSQSRTADSRRQDLRVLHHRAQQLPARQYVRLPCQHCHPAQHHTRPPGPLRRLHAEIYRCQDAYRAEPDGGRRVHLLERRPHHCRRTKEVRHQGKDVSLQHHQERGHDRLHRRRTVRHRVPYALQHGTGEPEPAWQAQHVQQSGSRYSGPHQRHRRCIASPEPE